jgi:hypothetical protein
MGTLFAMICPAFYGGQGGVLANADAEWIGPKFCGLERYGRVGKGSLLESLSFYVFLHPTRQTNDSSAILQLRNEIAIFFVSR